MANAKNALVFGASGISGWAYVNEMINDYPQEGIWGKVHALTNRPLDRKLALWPEDTRLNLVSGIDLLGGSQEELENTIKQRIPDVDEVTHVFFAAYIGGVDNETEMEINTRLLRRAVTAADRLSSKLEFVVLQTGGKYYGCHLLDQRPRDYFKVPLSESLGKLPPPHDQMFYYPQIDWLTEYAADKSWGWNEPRPDLIIGFVPSKNFFCIATQMGVFLSMWREKYGPGADCPFPGTAKSWTALSNDTSSDMIARETIHAALTAPWSKRKGEAFNVADQREPSCWKVKWPIMCSYFDLKGVKVEEDDPIEIRTFIKENFGIWEKMEKKYNLREGYADSPTICPGFEKLFMSLFDFDRQVDLSKIHSTGFTEERSTMQCWGGSWDRLRKVSILPAQFS